MVNRASDTSTLCDLKHLMIESKQKIPKFLEEVAFDEEVGVECGFCGGLGHRLTNCHVLEV